MPPVSARALLAALFLGAVPALVALLMAPEVLQRWDAPLALGVLVGGVLLARRANAERSGELPHKLGLALVVTTVVTATMHLMLPAPVSNDERAYLYQAELFAEGRRAEPLQVNEVVDFTLRRRQVHEDRGRDRDGDGQPDPGVRYAKYPPGTSAFLTPGTLLGWPPLMVVLASLADVLLVTAVARRYGLPDPKAAALMLALSPFFLLVQGSLQSEVVTLPFALLAWLGLLHARQRVALGGLLVGLACGAVFLTRPLTGVVLAAACALGLLSAPDRRRRFTALGLAVLGGLPMLGLSLLYNKLQTGDWATAPYELYAQTFGPWEDARLPAAERVPIDVYGNGDVLAGLGRQLARASVALGMLGLTLVGWWGLWRLRRRDGGAALAFALGLPLAYALHWYPGHWAYLGPLYTFESLGLVLIGALAVFAAAPPRWGRNLLLALLSWGAIAMVPRFQLIQEEAQQRSAPERVAAAMPDQTVLLLPYLAVPALHEQTLKQWTPSRRPAVERVAIVRELARPDYTVRALQELGLEGRPIYRLSPRTTAQDGEADHEAILAEDLMALR